MYFQKAGMATSDFSHWLFSDIGEVSVATLQTQIHFVVDYIHVYVAYTAFFLMPRNGDNVKHRIQNNGIVE